MTNTAGQVSRFITDGAYNGASTGEKIRQALGPDFELIIPPPSNAVMGDCETRNRHLAAIAETGRIGR